MKKNLPACFVILLVSCRVSRFEYVGNKTSPTQKVDVFVDEKAITRPYVVVGKGYETASWSGELKKEKMMALAIEKAKKNGADAVFYKETYIITSGTNINTYSRTDSVINPIIKGAETRSTTSITPVTGYWKNEILFLKYK